MEREWQYTESRWKANKPSLYHCTVHVNVTKFSNTWGKLCRSTPLFWLPNWSLLISWIVENVNCLSPILQENYCENFFKPFCILLLHCISHFMIQGYSTIPALGWSSVKRFPVNTAWVCAKINGANINGVFSKCS